MTLVDTGPCDPGTDAYSRELLGRRATDMRISGWSDAQIADELKLRHKAVRALISEYMAEHTGPAVEEWRTLVAARYETMFTQIAPRLERGNDDDAIASALKILEALRKLLGTDMPTKVDATVLHVDAEQIPLRQRVLQLEVMNKETAA